MSRRGKRLVELNAEAVHSFFEGLSKPLTPGLYRLRLHYSDNSNTDEPDESFGSFIRVTSLDEIYDVALASSKSWADCQPTGSGIMVFVLHEHDVELDVLLCNGMRIKLTNFLKPLLERMF